MARTILRSSEKRSKDAASGPFGTGRYPEEGEMMHEAGEVPKMSIWR